VRWRTFQAHRSPAGLSWSSRRASPSEIAQTTDKPSTQAQQLRASRSPTSVIQLDGRQAARSEGLRQGISEACVSNNLLGAHGREITGRAGTPDFSRSGRGGQDQGIRGAPSAGPSNMARDEHQRRRTAASAVGRRKTEAEMQWARLRPPLAIERGRSGAGPTRAE